MSARLPFLSVWRCDNFLSPVTVFMLWSCPTENTMSGWWAELAAPLLAVGSSTRNDLAHYYSAIFSTQALIQLQHFFALSIPHLCLCQTVSDLSWCASEWPVGCGLAVQWSPAVGTGWVNGWLGEWVGGWMGEWVSEWASEWTRYSHQLYDVVSQNHFSSASQFAFHVPYYL